MQLSLATIDTLAEMICGGVTNKIWENFPYRSSYYLTTFFRKSNLAFRHSGETRKPWVAEKLEEINKLPSQDNGLPSKEIIAVIKTLLDPTEFEQGQSASYNGNRPDHAAALIDVNRVLQRDGLQVDFINGECVISNLQTRVSSYSASLGRLLSREDEARRDAFDSFLANASEDEFTERVLVKLFQKMGFERVTVTGHRDRSMEFGRDAWMKYRLPTSHWLYIGIQVKKGKIHASGEELDRNIAGILAQLFMLSTYPVTDPETNSDHLFDHIYLVSSGEITKQARDLLTKHLANGMRRNVLFMDRNEILDLCVMYHLPIPNSGSDIADDDIPF